MGKKGTLLKELDDNLSLLNQKLKKISKNDEVSEDEVRLCQKQFKALTEINNFVSSYSWVGSEGAKQRIKEIRESGYDYPLIRLKTGMTENALKGLMYRLNKKLSSVIGEDTIDLIMSRYDKVALGVIQFRVSSGMYSMSDILLNETYENMPKEKLEIYRVEECQKEIEFLYKYSNFAMLTALKKCDIDKLAFLMYITQNTTERYKQDQKDLILLLQGINIDIDTYIEQLKERELDYAQMGYIQEEI